MISSNSSINERVELVVLLKGLAATMPPEHKLCGGLLPARLPDLSRQLRNRLHQLLQQQQALFEQQHHLLLAAACLGMQNLLVASSSSSKDSGDSSSNDGGSNDVGGAGNTLGGSGGGSNSSSSSSCVVEGSGDNVSAEAASAWAAMAQAEAEGVAVAWHRLTCLLLAVDCKRFSDASHWLSTYAQAAHQRGSSEAVVEDAHRSALASLGLLQVAGGQLLWRGIHVLNPLI
jgi:hypothetical protein